jgi:hypothetical protein
MSNIRTGKVFIRVGGEQVESLPDATLKDFMGGKRTPVVGNAVYGFTEEVVAPTIECQVAHGPSVSMKRLWDMQDVTAIFECDSGPVFVLSNAWVADVNELKAAGGFKLVINAKKCTEQVS